MSLALELTDQAAEARAVEQNAHDTAAAAAIARRDKILGGRS